jgi:hypothetical protein
MGATPVPGDITAAGSGIAALTGAEFVFRAAAWLSGDGALAHATNVGGAAGPAGRCLFRDRRRADHVSRDGRSAAGDPGHRCADPLRAAWDGHGDRICRGRCCV